MVQPPYAWPHDAHSEKIAGIVAEILIQSFNQSSTRIKDSEAVLSAARHIAQSHRFSVEVNEEPVNPLFEPLPVGRHGPPYAWPSPSAGTENNAAVIYQVMRDSFRQSSTKIRNDDAILSAARHVAQSHKLKIELALK
ncbi:MAG TPA: hypothetical protein VL625_08145 [Patescibacteria group bacterium]|jgi:hypothetical protein|nr:hypothetical protein [Patescibacteria group bacterium]